MSPVDTISSVNRNSTLAQPSRLSRLFTFSLADAKENLLADSVELDRRFKDGGTALLSPPRKNWKQQLEARFLLRTEDVKRHRGDVKLCNLHYVDRYLIRGAMPESEAEFKKLKDHHQIDTLIDLRGPETTRPEYIAYEKAMAQKHGLKYHHIPMESNQAPSLKSLMTFISLMRQVIKNDERAFVHCKHGIDRTGGVVVAYEMFFKSVPADKAFEDMKRFGYNRIHQWKKPAQEAFIKSGKLESSLSHLNRQWKNSAQEAFTKSGQRGWLLNNLGYSTAMERSSTELNRRNSF